MQNYFAITAPRIENNALDFNPLTNALNSFSQNQRQQFRDAYALKQDDYEKSINDRNYKEGVKKRLGEAASKMPFVPPEQQAQYWKGIIDEHNKVFGNQGLTPEDLDIKTGPMRLAASVGAIYDPLPRQLIQSQIDENTANAAKYRASAENGGVDYGKTGSIFQGPDGRFYATQFGTKGPPVTHLLEVDGQPLAPAKGFSAVGDKMRSNATGEIKEDISKDLRNAEKMKDIGKNDATIEINAGKAWSAINSAELKQTNAESNIRAALPKIDEWSASAGSQILKYWGGSEAANLASTLSTVKSYLAVNELVDLRQNSPSGSALGGVSDKDITLLQDAWQSVEQSQSVPQLKASLENLLDLMTVQRSLRKEAYEKTYGTYVPNKELQAYQEKQRLKQKFLGQSQQ